MDIIDFLESKETYNKVLQIISERTNTNPKELASRVIEEPKETKIDGFIAGGSVANVLNYIKHGVEPVIRDIDIFYPHDKNENDKSENKWVESEMLDLKGPIDTSLRVDGDWYGNKWVQPNGDFCLMISHSRDGVSNYIKVHVGTENKKINKKMIILRVFDINACQVGLDLKEEKILYTQDFVEFLRSRQMLVTIPVNPFQTTMRLHRKIKDMEAYCDFENEVKMLQYGTLCRENVANRFGSETYEKYLENKEMVDKYFDVTKVKKPKKYRGDNIFEPPTLYSEGHKLWMFLPKIKKYELDYVFDHPLTLINYWRTFMNPNLGGSKKRKVQKIMDKIFENGVSVKSLDDVARPIKPKEGVVQTTLGDKLSYIIEMCERHDVKFFDKLKDKKIYQINHWVWYNLLMYKKYYDCDFHPKHIDYINSFTEEHMNLRWLFNTGKSRMTIQEQYENIKTIKSISNQRGQWVIGELENMRHDDRIALSSSDDIGKSLESYLDKIDVNLSKPLVEPLDLSNFEHNGCVRELINTKDLREEGYRMGHCVGGYSSSLESGKSRMFHIECDGIGSTLEVGISGSGSVWPKFESAKAREIPQDWEDYSSREDMILLKDYDRKLEMSKFKIKQHYGRYPEKGNLEPTETNKELAESLVEFLNENCFDVMVKDILWERHELELKIRKEVYENKTKEENLKKAREAKDRGQPVVTVIDYSGWGSNSDYVVPETRNVVVDDVLNGEY